MIGMNLSELLEVIQVQRHDFLNHLQVISGLVQLNKPERVKEYIDHVLEEMKPLSAITRLKVPELKAVMLIALKEAQKHQIIFKFNINTTLEDCPLDGRVMGQGVEVCLQRLWQYLTLPGVTDRSVIFSIVEHEKYVMIGFYLPGLKKIQTTDMQQHLLADLGNFADQIKISINEQGEVCLCFPIN